MSEQRGTREQLLDAAISLVEAEGESAVRVDRVVEIAGFTKPVLYHHFTDKDALIVQAQTERYRRSLEWANSTVVAMTDSMKSKNEFEDRLAQAITGFVSEESRYHRRIRNEILGSSVSRPDLAQSVALANRVFISWLEDEIERWKQNGWIHPQFSSHELAEWWAVLIHGRFFVEVDSEHAESGKWLEVTMSSVRHLFGL